MWRIYYADGSTIEDSEGPPTGERARGVQVILQDHPDVGWFLQTGSDYYIQRNGRWYGVDIFGLFDFLMDSGQVVFGRHITNTEYKAILNEALEDRELARKGGLLKQERQPDGTA